MILIDRRKHANIITHLKIVEAWRVVHEDELKAAWYAYNNDGEIVKIKGLE